MDTHVEGPDALRGTAGHADLLALIRRTIDRHQRCVAEHGVEEIEELLDTSNPLRWRMARQRGHVAATLAGDPAEHMRHLTSLLRGVELVEAKI